MSETENHTLRLLREIQADIAAVKATQAEHSEALAHLLDRLPEIAADSSSNDPTRRGKCAGAARSRRRTAWALQKRGWR